MLRLHWGAMQNYSYIGGGSMSMNAHVRKRNGWRGGETTLKKTPQDALASKSVMFWRSEPTVSGEIDSFSVSTRNAEISWVSCVVSIIIKKVRFSATMVQAECSGKTSFDIAAAHWSHNLFMAKLLWLNDVTKDKKNCIFAAELER